MWLDVTADEPKGADEIWGTSHGFYVPSKAETQVDGLPPQ